MAEASALTGIGVPPEVAKRVGWRVASLAAAGTVQGGGTIIANGENVIINVTTSTGKSAVTLPANAAVGDMVFINIIDTTVDALVFPDTGGTIGSAAANGAITVAVGALLIKTTATLWAAVNSA